MDVCYRLENKTFQDFLHSLTKLQLFAVSRVKGISLGWFFVQCKKYVHILASKCNRWRHMDVYKNIKLYSVWVKIFMFYVYGGYLLFFPHKNKHFYPGSNIFQNAILMFT